MTRVLQVLPGLNRGGLETFVMNVYRAIDKSDIQFDFLTNMEDGDYADEITEMGGKIHYIPPRNKGYQAYCTNLKSFFERNKGKYNAIHYHESSLTSLEVLYYAKKAGIPIRIMHSHSSSIMGSKFHYITHYLGKVFIGSLANRYFGCSDKALDWMYGNSGVRSKAVIVNNGIETPRFKYNEQVRKKVRQELNIGFNDIVIGHVGRFSAVKNHTFLIDIFKELKNKSESAKLILVGVGELENEIRTKVETMNLSDSVIFTGLRADTYNIYQAMDIFVMPSLYEGLPVVLVEAQASGLPILCSDRISKMSIMSESFDMLPLDGQPEKWVTQVIQILKKPSDRSTGQINIIKSGYDINNVTTFLSSTYIDKSE